MYRPRVVQSLFSNAMWSRVVWNLWDEQQAWHYVFLCSRWQRLFLSHQTCPECTATSRSGWPCCRGQPDDKQAVCKSQGWLWSWHGFFLTSLHMQNSWHVYGNALGIAEEWVSFTFGCGQLKLDWLYACGIASTWSSQICWQHSYFEDGGISLIIHFTHCVVCYSLFPSDSKILELSISALAVAHVLHPVVWASWLFFWEEQRIWVLKALIIVWLHLPEGGATYQNCQWQWHFWQSQQPLVQTMAKHGCCLEDGRDFWGTMWKVPTTEVEQGNELQQEPLSAVNHALHTPVSLKELAQMARCTVVEKICSCWSVAGLAPTGSNLNPVWDLTKIGDQQGSGLWAFGEDCDTCPTQFISTSQPPCWDNDLLRDDACCLSGALYELEVWGRCALLMTSHDVKLQEQQSGSLTVMLQRGTDVS